MVLITGGTGTVGSHLVRQLAMANVKFRVLARDPKKVFSSPQVETLQGALDDLPSLEKAMAGIETLFLLTNSTPQSAALQNAAIDTAKRRGLKRVVRLSVLGADPHSPLSLGRWHGETDAHLKASGLEWIILQPGSFMQNTLGNAASIKGEGAFYGCSGQGKQAVIDARDIAAAAVRVLSTGGHVGQVYKLTGPELLSAGDIAMKLTRYLGRPITYVDVAPAQFKAGLVAAGLPEWLASDFALMHGFQAQGAMATMDPALATLIGDVRTFDEFLKTSGQAFKA